MLQNNLLRKAAQGRTCTALGIKVVTSNEVVLLAKAAEYDSVFIDQEHSVFSTENVGSLCSAALLAGITPFVRVPYRCGPGHIQRILDAGAMGVVFPHVSSAEEAQEAVACMKYPPRGNRSLTAALPQFYFQRIDAKELMQEIDSLSSTVFVMVETKQCLESIDAIAAVEGVDVLLLGCNDLSLELGILSEWEHPEFQKALRTVATAASKAGKIFGIAGMYTRPDIAKFAVSELGARFVLGHFDIGLLAMGMNKNMEQMRQMGP
ncbi:Pyruvate/Phosphoenolpyruvate kinase [Thozetella sp. PMI_491]|nr:Pyruvate/Phosphoenolpyruvate kinase [Thozetella sp. PMI_491]